MQEFIPTTLPLGSVPLGSPGKTNDKTDNTGKLMVRRPAPRKTVKEHSSNMLNALLTGQQQYQSYDVSIKQHKVR